jgi:hypothetical protein
VLRCLGHGESSGREAVLRVVGGAETKSAG